MKINKIKFFLLFILFFAASSGYSSSLILKKKIKDLIQKVDPSINIGIVVQDTFTGANLLSLNENRFYQPASTLKILTGVASLLKLGPAFRYHTAFYKKGKNLYLKFTGDPTLTFKDLESLVKELKKQGVCTISGDLIIDNFDFKLPTLGSGWAIGTSHYAYGAPICTDTLNRNSVCFHIVPASFIKGSTTINYPADAVLYRFRNISYTDTCQQDDGIERSDLDINNSEISVKGCIPYGKPALKICLPVPCCSHYMKKSLKQLFYQEGIILKGTIKSSPFLENDKTLLVAHYSSPLSDILKDGIKKSDNLILESLFRVLAQQSLKPILKEGKAGEFIREILEKDLSIVLDKVVQTDGSGLSHYNVVTPSQLSDLLKSILKNPLLLSDFYPTFSVAGQDGTLETRLKDLPTGVRVLAKTGSLSKVSTLAGFVEFNGIPRTSFVIMINGISGSDAPYKSLEDEIVLEIIKNIPNGTAA